MPRRGERFPRTVPGDQLGPFGFPRMVGEFCEWMGTRGLSPKTIDDRHKLLGYLAGWLLERGITRPAEVTKPVLDGYQRWLFHYRRPDGKPLTFRSQHTYLVPARAFFKWAARENRANAALDGALRSDSAFASQFDELIPGASGAVSRAGGRATPAGYAWHHAPSSAAGGRAGVMQLVPTWQHAPGSIWQRLLHPRGIGGYSEWAIPLGAPGNL